MLASPSDIIYFLEVANTLNLSRAAERLGISQPSLSNAIMRLENTLGIKLLIRHKRGVHLTQAGKQLLNHARKLLQQWNELKTKTLASHQQIQGSYIIGCAPAIAKYTLPYVLPDLIKNHSKLEIQLKHDISRRITEEVISLTIDIGIVINPVKHPDLIIYKLFKDEVTLWQDNKKIKKLDAPPLICDPELSQTQFILKQLKKQKFKIHRLLTSNNLDVVATMTASGCGIGILPRRVVMSTYPNKLQPLSNTPIYDDEVCIVYRHENRDILAIQVIIAEIKKIVDKK